MSAVQRKQFAQVDISELRRFPVLDIQAFLMNFRGMEALAMDVAREFQQSLPQFVETLRSNLFARDYRGVEIAAHTLKGAVSNLRAERSRRAAFELEQVAQAKDLELCERAFQKLLACLEELEANLPILLGDRERA